MIVVKDIFCPLGVTGHFLTALSQYNFADIFCPLSNVKKM